MILHSTWWRLFYFYSKNQSLGPLSKHKLQTKEIPKEKVVNIDYTRIRKIDLNPPPIFSESSIGMQRLVPGKLISDSTHHTNGQIKS